MMRDPMFGRRAARPYAGGTGSAGSVTSHERREREDQSGISDFRQTMVLGHLQAAGPDGLTWFELQRRINGVTGAGANEDAAVQRGGWHHGQVSGALSTLHKVKAIARLTLRREDPEDALVTEDGATRKGRSTSAVYVALEHVGGRPTEDQGTKRRSRLERRVAELEERNAFLEEDHLRIVREVLPLEMQNAMLQQHNVGLEAEADGWKKEAIAASAREALALDAAAVETENRTRETSGHLKRIGGLEAAVGSLQSENALLRMSRWLTSMEVDEWTIVDKIGARLATMVDAPETTMAPLSLKAVRMLVQVTERLGRKEPSTVTPEIVAEAHAAAKEES